MTIPVIYPTGMPNVDRDSAERAYALDRAAHDALDALQCLIRKAGDKPSAEQAPLYEAERILLDFANRVTGPTATAWWRHFNPYVEPRTLPDWATYGT